MKAPHMAMSLNMRRAGENWPQAVESLNMRVRWPPRVNRHILQCPAGTISQHHGIKQEKGMKYEVKCQKQKANFNTIIRVP
jgi:hypothetical protein